MIDRGVDSHCHVFDTARFAYAESAAYKPPPNEQGDGAALAAVLDAHGLSHALLVNPTSGYGYDSRCMLDAIRASPRRFKGIARVRPDIDDATLAELADNGVIGIRIDMIGDGAAIVHDRALPRLLARVRELDWQVHVQCEKDQLAAAVDVLRAARVPLVFDHCGRPDPARGVSQPGFEALLEMGRDGHAVKLSGPFRFSNGRAPYRDVGPFVEALIATFTVQRCVWGSDWPFLRLPHRVDYGPVLGQLKRWLPNEDDRRAVLWETPRRLFGFN